MVSSGTARTWDWFRKDLYGVSKVVTIISIHLFSQKLDKIT